MTFLKEHIWEGIVGDENQGMARPFLRFLGWQRSNTEQNQLGAQRMRPASKIQDVTSSRGADIVLGGPRDACVPAGSLASVLWLG